LIKTKLSIHDDPIFERLDPKGIFDVAGEEDFLEPLDSRRALIQNV
jgi:hypothetical protein